MNTLKRLSLLAGLVLGLRPAPSAAETFWVTGHELTGETRTVAGDGSVRTVVQAGVDGSLFHVENRERTAAHALVTMSITTNQDVLVGAQLTYAQFGRRGFTVTVQIDPCWFEYVNERDATAAGFGQDVVARIEEESGRALEAHLRRWLAQRLALLGAKTAEPYVKAGITLVPPGR